MAANEQPESGSSKELGVECEICGGDSKGYDGICLSCRREGWIHGADGEIRQVVDSGLNGDINSLFILGNECEQRLKDRGL